MNVDTMLKDPQTPRYAQRRTHRTYTPQFKAELVVMCGVVHTGDIVYSLYRSHR